MGQVFSSPYITTIQPYSFVVKCAMAVARLAAAVAIKQEPPDSPTATTPRSLGATESHTHPAVEPRPVHPVELDERILNLCSQNPKGISDDIITADQPQINTEQRMKALQRLLSQACLYICVYVCIIVYLRKVVHVCVPEYFLQYYTHCVYTHSVHTHAYGMVVQSSTEVVLSRV